MIPLNAGQGAPGKELYAGIDAGTRGTYFFDAFESRRLSYIGQ